MDRSDQYVVMVHLSGVWRGNVCSASEGKNASYWSCDRVAVGEGQSIIMLAPTLAMNI